MNFYLRWACLAIFAFSSIWLRSGTVTTKDGQGYSGLVKFEDSDHLTVGPPKGPRKKIPLKNVVAATFDIPADPEMFESGAPSAGKGYGILAAYYDRPNFKGRVIYRIDRTINHQWRSRQPVFDLPRDYFSVRWTGELEPPVTGEYTFTLNANDGGKLMVGDLTLGKWEALSGFREVGKLALEAGKRVRFEFDFFDNYGEASARVLWKGPGFQESPISPTQLYPDTNKAPKGFKSQSGLLGCYYQNRFFYGDGMLSIDPKMDFSPVTPPEEFSDKNYSVRWTGQLEVPYTEEYSFKISTDEGVRLWVDQLLVINELSNRAPRVFTGKVPLQRGERIGVRLESVHRAGQGNLKVVWSSKSKPESILGGEGVYPSYEPAEFKDEGGGEGDESQTLGVFSWAGSRIASSPVSADDSSVKFSKGTYPERISTINVSRIVMRPVPVKYRNRITDNRTGVLLANGDFVEGQMQSLDNDTLVLNSVLFGVKVYGIDQLMAIVLAGIKAPTKTSRFNLRLGNGSQFYVRGFRVDKKDIIVDDPSVGKMRIPLAEFNELRAIDR